MRKTSRKESFMQITNYPKVSVIVPVYKVEFYLARCLKSICNQSMKELEIIIVDEGLIDQDRMIMDEFMSHDKRIRAIHTGGGYGACVNEGIIQAKGEYIGIVESDDFIEPDMYENLYKCAKQLDAEIVKSPFYQYYDEKNEDLAPLMDELIFQLPTDRCFSLEQYPIMLATHPAVWAGIYKASWLKHLGIQFKEKGVYLDIIFRFKTLITAKRIGWILKPTYHWRITNPTSTNAFWNIDAAIHRWDELFSFCDENGIDICRFEPYLLPEAFKNIFVHYDILTRTGEQRRNMKALRLRFSDESIRRCIYIGKGEKIDFLNANMDVLCIKRYLNSIMMFLSQKDFQCRCLLIWLSLYAFAYYINLSQNLLSVYVGNAIWKIAHLMASAFWGGVVLLFGLKTGKMILHYFRRLKKN